MPFKKVTITHIYEVSFRMTSESELSKDDLHHMVQERLVGLRGAGPPDIRELCMEQSDSRVEYCMMTEGHRGKHEGPTGDRWGNDL